MSDVKHFGLAWYVDMMEYQLRDAPIGTTVIMPMELYSTLREKGYGRLRVFENFCNEHSFTLVLGDEQHIKDTRK